MFSRRDMLAADGRVGQWRRMPACHAGDEHPFGRSERSAAGRDQRQEPEEHQRSRSADPAIRDQLSGAFSPPATDVGSMPLSLGVIQQRADGAFKMAAGRVR